MAEPASPALALDLFRASGSLGAEVRGLDLRAIGEAETAALEAALAEHLVLFFRDQHLSPEELRTFSGRFGELEIHPFIEKLDEEAYPEVCVLDTTDSKSPKADLLHTDVTFSANPPIGSVLQMIECPEAGGDTIFSSLQRAHDTLSTAMQEMIAPLTAIHRTPQGKGTSAEHPVVRVHPVTGRKSLYVNRQFTYQIVQLSRPESQALLGFLLRWIEQPHFSCRWHWTPGSIAMWDNRTTLHSAIHDGEERRLMHRCTILGDHPQAAAEARWPRHEPDFSAASGFFGIGGYEF